MSCSNPFLSCVADEITVDSPPHLEGGRYNLGHWILINSVGFEADRAAPFVEYGNLQVRTEQSMVDDYNNLYRIKITKQD